VTAFWVEMRVGERIDSRWSGWLGGLEVLPLENSDRPAGTLLRGCLPDQAALFGILSRMYSLNLTLLELKRTDRSD